jgi:TonB family protein
MKTKRFNLFTAIFAVLISVSFANAQLELIIKEGAKFIVNDIKKEREVIKKIEEIQPTYDAWIKSLDDYISKTGGVGDCNAIGFKYLSNNHGETPNFSYECGVRENSNIAFLNVKNKVKIGDCNIGSVFKVEFDIRKNELDAFSFPINEACVFFQPSCKTLISGSCPPNMVFIGGGTFTMGCDHRLFCSDNESLLRNVTVNSFCIGKYEVTQNEWQEVMGNNPSKFKNCGSNCPVEQVNWNDAQTFISKFNAKTGMNYRLPTEAEWEYAARGGCKGKVGKIENLGSNEPWYNKNSNNQTHSVGGAKRSNPLGIYNMSGNVWEWVSDWYGVYNKSDVNNPKGPSRGSQKIARGGAWSSAMGECRVTKRSGETPDTRKDILGFRLVHPPVNKATVSQNTTGLQTNGKTVQQILQNAAIKRPANGETGGFNEGYAEGGSGGLDGMMGGLMGGGGGSIGTKSKGGIKAPSAQDIDMGSGGARSRAEIMAVVNQRVNGLKSIYNRFLKNKPGFKGKVTLKFTIAPSGDIVSISIVSSTTGYPEFNNAIKDHVSHWKWKQINSGNTTPTIPFNFEE